MENYIEDLAYSCLKRLDLILNKIKQIQDSLKDESIDILINFLQQHIFLNIGQQNLSKAKDLIFMQFDLFDENKNDKLAQIIYSNMACLCKNTKDTLHWIHRLDDFTLPSPLLVSIRNLLIVTNVFRNNSIEIIKNRKRLYDDGIYKIIYNSCLDQIETLKSSKLPYSSTAYKYLYSTLYTLESAQNIENTNNYLNSFFEIHDQQIKFNLVLDTLSIFLVSSFSNNTEIVSRGIQILSNNAHKLPLAKNSLEFLFVKNNDDINNYNPNNDNNQNMSPKNDFNTLESSLLTPHDMETAKKKV